jgi:uncharacterized membrane protein YgcG
VCEIFYRALFQTFQTIRSKQLCNKYCSHKHTRTWCTAVINTHARGVQFVTQSTAVINTHTPSILSQRQHTYTHMCKIGLALSSITHGEWRRGGGDGGGGGGGGGFVRIPSPNDSIEGPSMVSIYLYRYYSRRITHTIESIRDPIL